MATAATPTQASPEAKPEAKPAEPRKGGGAKLTLSTPGGAAPKGKPAAGQGVPVGHSGRLIGIDD